MQVDGREFIFPEGWIAVKYDDWAFYRNQFQSCAGGNKAVDVVAINNKTLWLIELKDYKAHQRTKPTALPDEIALKARDTIAGIFAAAVNAGNEEKEFALKCRKCNSIRIALQLEQPLKYSKLFPRAIDPVAIKQKLRKLVKSIDAHPLVCESRGAFNIAPWSVL